MFWLALELWEKIRGFYIFLLLKKRNIVIYYYVPIEAFAGVSVFFDVFWHSVDDWFHSW